MRICLDAGHNWSLFDTGAQGNSLREQDITFAIADKIRVLFSQTDVEVIMTRPTLETNLGTSVNSSINKRVEISNSNKCDLFVSIHVNAGKGQGTETLVYKKGGDAEKLATIVNNNLVKDLGLVSRGVKDQNVGVLRLTNCSAILIETAFIDTKEDADKLLNRQDDFAKSIYNSICTYLGDKIKFKEVVKNTEFEKALDYLVNKKVISTKDYWLQNYDKLQYVDQLIIKFAQYIGFELKDLSITNPTLKPVHIVMEDTKYYTENGIHFLEIPISKFKVEYWDKPKKTSTIKNYGNLGYFGRYKIIVNGKPIIFTKPVGNFCGDIVEGNYIKEVIDELKKMGTIENGKFKANSDTSRSTLIVTKDGKCRIEKCNTLPSDVVYAVSGAPIVLNGKDPSFKNEVLTEGWDTSIVRATLHGFITVKNNKIIYMGLETKTKDCFTTSEVYNKLKPYGFDTILKIDGGSSYVFDYGGKNILSTDSNPQINNIIRF